MDWQERELTPASCLGLFKNLLFQQWEVTADHKLPLPDSTARECGPLYFLKRERKRLIDFDIRIHTGNHFTHKAI